MVVAFRILEQLQGIVHLVLDHVMEGPHYCQAFKSCLVFFKVRKKYILLLGIVGVEVLQLLNKGNKLFPSYLGGWLLHYRLYMVCLLSQGFILKLQVREEVVVFRSLPGMACEAFMEYVYNLVQKSEYFPFSHSLLQESMKNLKGILGLDTCDIVLVLQIELSPILLAV